MLIPNFLPYGHSFPSRERALDALEDFYATGELSQDEVVRIERRGNRHVILVAEDMT